MNKIPCKKCPQCGIFNDFTVEECECGEKLNNIGAKFIDADGISPELYGEIDTSLKVYVQKCSACGALNYTNNPANPVKMCYNCHKTRISAIAPVECADEDNDEKQEVSVSEVSESKDGKQIRSQVAQSQQSYVVDDEDDEEDEDDDFIQWKAILANIQKTIENTPQDSQANSIQQNTRQTDEPKVTQVVNDFDEDDDEIDDWSGILSSISKQKNDPILKQKVITTSVKKTLTLTAIRYGRLSFTIDAGQDTYMLGRSAHQGSFLSQDGRVGNEHCYLFYRNGEWFVRDNNSKNGTAVNSRDIGLNGECMLSDGDELKLGHHSDSVAFHITIN